MINTPIFYHTLSGEKKSATSKSILTLGGDKDGRVFLYFGATVDRGVGTPLLRRHSRMLGDTRAAASRGIGMPGRGMGMPGRGMGMPGRVPAWPKLQVHPIWFCSIWLRLGHNPWRPQIGWYGNPPYIVAYRRAGFHTRRSSACRSYDRISDLSGGSADNLWYNVREPYQIRRIGVWAIPFVERRKS